MSDIAVQVQGLSKQYRIGQRERYPTLRDALASGFSRPLHAITERFRRVQPDPGNSPAGPRIAGGKLWALKDVSFTVPQGQVMGIIGRNGAGKSTLLKVLSQITAPTQGRIEIYGRLASLLEVGTGFHPELTGRENIYLNGSILGMKRAEIERRFDEIISFAEIEPFLETPVKRYSSGMYLRLAFAVAAHLESEILLMDEVLAVGDAAFQKKCLGKMSQVASSGRTVLFVSHNMAAVQQLTRASILLDQGRVVAQGPSPEVIHQYLSSGLSHQGNVYPVEHAPRRYPELCQEVQFLSVALEDCPNGLVPADDPLRLLLTVRANQAVQNFRFSITIFQFDGTPVGNVFGPAVHALQQGETATYCMELHDLRLARGRYYCALAAGTGNHLGDRVEYDIILDVLHFEMLGPLGEDGVMSEWFSVWGPIRFPEPQVTRVE